MKPTNATLNALLATRQFYTADLYAITLNDGTVLRYASGQSNISFGGNTYLAGGQTGPYFDRKDNKAKVTWRTGSGQDQLVIDVVPGSSSVKNQPFLSACRLGFFDGADFQLSRAFMSTYGIVQTGCAVLMFRGRVAEVDADRSLATFTVNDYRELFSQQLPRNLFQAACVNTLGDTSCTVNLSSTQFSESGTVGAGSDTFTLHSNSLVQPSDFYDNGKIKFTSGQLAGLSFGVSLFSNSTSAPCTITPIQPFPLMPALGDAFTIFAGCDRSTGAGGCTKFANIANFRGFPYVPAPELAL